MRSHDAPTDDYTPIEETGVGKKAAGPVGWLDDRLGLAGIAKKNLRKVFPEHWSFMLGEIALWSFVVLLLTGVFLTFWFQPSMAEIEYTRLLRCRSTVWRCPRRTPRRWTSRSTSAADC